MEDIGVLHFVRRRAHDHIHESALCDVDTDLHSICDIDRDSPRLQHSHPVGDGVAATYFTIHAYRYKNFNANTACFFHAVANCNGPCHIDSCAYPDHQSFRHTNGHKDRASVHAYTAAQQHANRFAGAIPDADDVSYAQPHAVQNADCLVDTVTHAHNHFNRHADSLSNRDRHA